VPQQPERERRHQQSDEPSHREDRSHLDAVKSPRACKVFVRASPSAVAGAAQERTVRSRASCPPPEPESASHVQTPSVAAATSPAIAIGRRRSRMDAFGPSHVQATKARPMAAGLLSPRRTKEEQRPDGMLLYRERDADDQKSGHDRVVMCSPINVSKTSGFIAESTNASPGSRSRPRANITTP